MNQYTVTGCKSIELGNEYIPANEARFWASLGMVIIEPCGTPPLPLQPNWFIDNPMAGKEPLP